MPVAARHRLAVQILDGVHEVFVGDLKAARPGGESGKQVLDRYLANVAAIRSAHRAGTAVLVSHGAATRLAVVALASNIDGSFAGPQYLANTATVQLEADGTGWRCLRWDTIELARD